MSDINKTESSIHIPEETARVAPLTLVIDRSLITPPEPPHTLSARVTRLSASKPSTIGALPLPRDKPIPYRHVPAIPCTSCPPPKIVRLVIWGFADENRSTATKSAFRTVRLLINGSESTIIIPREAFSIFRWEIDDPRPRLTEVKCMPSCLPSIEFTVTCWFSVPKTESLPSISIDSPSPILISVPGCICTT